MDLQTAVDTAKHAILLKKRKGVGIDEFSICWFISSLTGREQVTDIDVTIIGWIYIIAYGVVPPLACTILSSNCYFVIC